MPLELRPQITQKIKARVKLLNYKPNSVSGVDDGSYSVYSLIGQSKVNKPYVFELTFVSDKSINIEDISDTDVHVILEDMVDNKIVKDIFGKIYSVSEDSVVANKYMYKIKIVNPMYYLGFTNKYEIFHNKKSIDIISEIIRRYSSILNVRLDLKIDNQNTPIQEYTTQYDQSDLDFILMLCQKEGYSLIFDYSCNDPYVLTLCELNEHVINNKYPSTASYNHSKTFQSSFFVQDFYDKDKPSLEYVVKSGANITSSIKDNSSTKQLRTDIQREKFRDKLNLLNESFFKDLNRYTKIDSLSQYVKSNEILGTSLELHLKDSMCVTLDDEDANKSIDVIILEVNYKGYFPNALDEYASHESQIQYEINFTSIPKDIIYKPPLTIIKPKIYGIQTAIVSNSNPNTKDYINTIDTDELGRVKVLFHFERNQTTSCYLRVSNISSGTQYGTQFIPRVNSEVIVSFVNGDPDYPIIIGTLHNGENVNPYPLPNNKTQSFIKTYSIPQYEDKQGYNEILFEDKRGAEQLNLRAQKDMNTLVLNDKNQNVKNNENVLIEANKNETIKKDSTLTVGKNYTQNIKENQITTVDVDKIVSVKGDCEIEVEKDFTTVVQNDMNITVDEDVVTQIKEVLTQYVEGDVTLNYLENLFTQIGIDMGIEVDGIFHLECPEVKYEAAQEIDLEGYDAITLRVGENSVTIDESGIHIHTLNYDSNSSFGGVSVEDVGKTKAKKKEKLSSPNFTE